MENAIRCDTCPYSKDSYPGELDPYGNHFHVCGLTGNMVYPAPRRERRHSGNGWYNYEKPSTCGLFSSVEDAMRNMSEPERRRYLGLKDGEDDV